MDSQQSLPEGHHHYRGPRSTDCAVLMKCSEIILRVTQMRSTRRAIEVVADEDHDAEPVHTTENRNVASDQRTWAHSFKGAKVLTSQRSAGPLIMLHFGRTRRTLAAPTRSSTPQTKSECKILLALSRPFRIEPPAYKSSKIREAFFNDLEVVVRDTHDEWLPQPPPTPTLEIVVDLPKITLTPPSPVGTPRNSISLAVPEFDMLDSEELSFYFDPSLSLTYHSFSTHIFSDKIATQPKLQRKPSEQIFTTRYCRGHDGQWVLERKDSMGNVIMYESFDSCSI
ncbi:hypothetical protein BJ742DRAFT_148573 [Cladochytrium replicatum]|nr:hypothetical protein BJ742DRAFT_148573 [Cladochytrium replicatum]